MLDQHHSEVPCDKGLNDSSGDQQYGRQIIEFSFDCRRIVLLPARLQRSIDHSLQRRSLVRISCMRIGDHPQQEVVLGQAVEHELRNNIAPQQECLILERAAMHLFRIANPVVQFMPPKVKDHQETDDRERSIGHRHQLAKTMIRARPFGAAQSHDRYKTDPELGEPQQVDIVDDKEVPGDSGRISRQRVNQPDRGRQEYAAEYPDRHRIAPRGWRDSNADVAAIVHFEPVPS